MLGTPSPGLTSCQIPPRPACCPGRCCRAAAGIMCHRARWPGVPGLPNHLAWALPWGEQRFMQRAEPGWRRVSHQDIVPSPHFWPMSGPLISSPGLLLAISLAVSARSPHSHLLLAPNIQFLLTASRPSPPPCHSSQDPTPSPSTTLPIPILLCFLSS